MTEWLLLALSLLLMLSCGVFGAAEYSLVTVDRATVERAADSGDKRAQELYLHTQSRSRVLAGTGSGLETADIETLRV